MSSQILSKAVGIDLGTTNSAVAVMNPTDTEVLIHRDPKAKSETTPSCVWKNPKTGELVVGRLAVRRVGTSPPPIRSIKRLMGQQTRVAMTDEEVSPIEVSAAILAEMKRQIETDVARLGGDGESWIVDRAIVTVPAYFDQPAIDATRQAGEQAGLRILDLLQEPTAAACHHCWRTGTQNGVFMVYDLGGGTFDVTVLRVTAGTFEVLGISGNNRLGGDDLDTALALRLQEILLDDDWALDLDARNDPEDRLRFEHLRFLAEGVKKALSLSSEFVLRDQGVLKDKENSPVIIETLFERPEIDAILKPIIERTLPYCREALEHAEQKAGVTLDKVDDIILAGGSTHYPLVRDLVRESFCADDATAEPRARCQEPVYEKVDSVVALGAAVRAAAVGGLAVYNPQRTVRVSFRGTGATGASKTHVGGKIETLTGDLDLEGGRVRLLCQDFEDETPLNNGGSFGFTRVPLQSGAESLLSFEVYDRGGALVATAGRPVSQSREAAQRPTGGATSTAVMPKAILLEVSRAGKSYLKELIPALDPLPTRKTFEFNHPGAAETLLFPLYQKRRKIQVIRVPVDASIPKGTPITLDVQVDPLSLITVKGRIGAAEFDFAVEPPAERGVPGPREVEALDEAFRQAAEYLPAGKRNVAELRWAKVRMAFTAAHERGDDAQAIHEFEEMEEIVASMEQTEAGLQPPREDFDRLVEECVELNRAVARAAAEEGQPHDHRDMEQGIEAQREQGEKAFSDENQQAWGDAFMMLENLRNHLVGLYRKLKQAEDTRTDTEKAADHARHAEGEAAQAAQMAAAQQRQDLQQETQALRRKLAELAREAQKNPRGVQEKIAQVRNRLGQIMNVLLGKSQKAENEEGVLVVDTST